LFTSAVDFVIANADHLFRKDDIIPQREEDVTSKYGCLGELSLSLILQLIGIVLNKININTFLPLYKSRPVQAHATARVLSLIHQI